MTKKKKKKHHPLPGGFIRLPLNFSHKPTFQKRSLTQSLSSPVQHLCAKAEKDPLAGQTFMNDAPSGRLRGTFWISAPFCPLGRCPCIGNTCHLWKALPSSFIKYIVLSWEDLSPFMGVENVLPKHRIDLDNISQWLFLIFIPFDLVSKRAGFVLFFFGPYFRVWLRIESLNRVPGEFAANF